MSNHTPGPWEPNWIIRGQAPILGHRDNGEPIPGIRPVVCHIPEPCRDDTGSANASLIAAAPDLLAALRDVMGWFDSSAIRHLMSKQGYQAECHRIINDARKAIAKAES